MEQNPERSRICHLWFNIQNKVIGRDIRKSVVKTILKSYKKTVNKLENTDINNIRGKHTVLKEVKSREGWLKNSKSLKKIVFIIQ